MVRPGAMCSKVIVGMQFCGFAGKCEHQRAPSLRNCASSQVQQTDGADGVQGMEADRVKRLQAAIEGECDGLAIDEHHARAILHYVDGVKGPDHG